MTVRLLLVLLVTLGFGLTLLGKSRVLFDVAVFVALVILLMDLSA